MDFIFSYRQEIMPISLNDAVKEEIDRIKLLVLNMRLAGKHTQAKAIATEVKGFQQSLKFALNASDLSTIYKRLIEII